MFRLDSMTGTLAKNTSDHRVDASVGHFGETAALFKLEQGESSFVFVGSWTVWSPALAVEGRMLGLLWPIGYAVPMVVTAVSVSPAPVAQNIESVSAVSVAPVPVVKYIEAAPAALDSPVPVLEHIEPAPAVSHMTPAPSWRRVLERRMKEGGGLEDRAIVLAVCELAEQIVTKLQSDDRMVILSYVKIKFLPRGSLDDSHCVVGMIFSEITANRYLRLPSCLATGAFVV